MEFTVLLLLVKGASFSYHTTWLLGGHMQDNLPYCLIVPES